MTLWDRTSGQNGRTFFLQTWPLSERVFAQRTWDTDLYGFFSVGLLSMGTDSTLKPMPGRPSLLAPMTRCTEVPSTQKASLSPALLSAILPLHCFILRRCASGKGGTRQTGGRKM